MENVQLPLTEQTIQNLINDLYLLGSPEPAKVPLTTDEGADAKERGL